MSLSPKCNKNIHAMKFAYSMNEMELIIYVYTSNLEQTCIRTG